MKYGMKTWQHGNNQPQGYVFYDDGQNKTVQSINDLSDETKVGDVPWSKLKKAAMDKDF